MVSDEVCCFVEHLAVCLCMQREVLLKLTSSCFVSFLLGIPRLSLAVRTNMNCVRFGRPSENVKQTGDSCCHTVLPPVDCVCYKLRI
jgi:hypothetical protein